MGSSLNLRVPFRVLFIWVPSFIGDSKRDPNLENYTYMQASNRRNDTHGIVTRDAVCRTGMTHAIFCACKHNYTKHLHMLCVHMYV